MNEIENRKLNPDFEHDIANRHVPERVEVIQVIKTLSTIGSGTKISPTRILVRYWTMDGKLLCEHDPNTLSKKNGEKG